MEGLPTSILPREARFAYVASAFRLAEIYVPFIDKTEARNSRTWHTLVYKTVCMISQLLTATSASRFP
jgi:hypothetical protein